MIELTDKKKRVCWRSTGTGTGNVLLVPDVKNISGRMMNWKILST